MHRDPQQPNFFNQPQVDLDMLNTSSNIDSDEREEVEKRPSVAFGQENPEELPSDNEANLKEREE